MPGAYGGGEEPGPPGSAGLGHGLPVLATGCKRSKTSGRFGPCKCLQGATVPGLPWAPRGLGSCRAPPGTRVPAPLLLEASRASPPVPVLRGFLSHLSVWSSEHGDTHPRGLLPRAPRFCRGRCVTLGASTRTGARSVSAVSADPSPTSLRALWARTLVLVPSLMSRAGAGLLVPRPRAVLRVFPGLSGSGQETP